MKALELCENQKKDEGSIVSKVEITNLSVKKFHLILNKNSASSFQVFQVVTKGPTKNLESEQAKDSRIKLILDKFKSVFWS